MSKLYIYGAGGFAREVFCLLVDAGRRDDVIAFVESDSVFVDRTVMGVSVIPVSKVLPRSNFVVAVGEPAARKRVVESELVNHEFETVIHPTAVLSEWVSIGQGSIITAGCILTCNITLGQHVQLNLLTTVGHDCVLGDYFTSAPAVNISGNVTTGECVYFGTNSCVRNGISLATDVTVGMGAVLVKDALESGVYVGNPARRK